MSLKKIIFRFVPEDYHKIIKKYRKGNHFIVNEIRQEEFVSAKLLKGALLRQ